MKKEVTLHLVDFLQDQEGWGNVRLEGVKLTGTPLQVAMIFNILNDLPGQPDVATYDDLENLKKGEKVLKEVRDSPPNPDGSFDYIDPDN